MSEVFNEARISYFYEAVTRGSIRAAADFLDVAQSAVSRQIALLEKETSQALIERHSRGVRATEAGNFLVEYYRGQLASKRDLFSRFEELNNLKTGHVDIVMGEGFITDMFTGPMQSFCSQWPNVTINIELAGTAEIVRLVAGDIADIGLLYSTPTEPEVVSRAAFTQPLSVITSTKFPELYNRASVKLKELTAYPVTLSQQGAGSRQMLKAVEWAEKVHLRPTLVTNSLLIQKRFEKTGLGIAFLPMCSVNAEIASGELYAVKLDHVISEGAEAHLITRVGRKTSPAATRMLQLMAAQLRTYSN